MIERAALHLFGRHVPRRAEQLARACHPARRALERLRKAEVRDPHLVAAIDEDVVRLEIAVHHALTVRGLERLGDLAADADRAVDREASFPAEGRVEVLAVHERHGDELQPADVSEIVDAQDVAVRHLRAEQQLLLEALQDAGLVEEHGTNDLDGDGAIELAVARAEHRPHAALAEDGLDAVARPEVGPGMEDGRRDGGRAGVPAWTRRRRRRGRDGRIGCGPGGAVPAREATHAGRRLPCPALRTPRRGGIDLGVAGGAVHGGRSIARSISRSIGQSMGWSVGRSAGQSIAQSPADGLRDRAVEETGRLRGWPTESIRAHATGSASSRVATRTNRAGSNAASRPRATRLPVWATCSSSSARTSASSSTSSGVAAT